MNFSCKKCGYTVQNIPDRFFGKKIRCHQCKTVQQIPFNISAAGRVTPKKQDRKKEKVFCIGALVYFLAVLVSLVFRYGGGLFVKSGPLQLIIDVVFPVFSIMLVGYLSGVFGLFGAAATEALNRYVFYIALPALFAVSMSRVSLGEVIILPFLAAFCGGLVVTFILTLILGRVIFNDGFGVNTLRATSTAHANAGYMGIPFFMLLYGESGLLPAVVSAVVMGVGLVGIATVLLEMAQGRNGKEGNLIVNVLIGVLKSPLLLSAGAGLTLSGFGIELPGAAATFCETLGASSGPCALFAIGLFMAAKPISSGALEVFWLTGMKLVIQPLVTAWLAFKVLSLDPKLASAAVLLSALPVGSLPFVLAQKYRLYVHRATSLILITTMMSLVTLSLLFVILGLA
jgi:malonate transporter and related proteins